MGIPFLTTRLQPYSKRCSLGTEGSKQHSVALIDGPNLVHHVYTALNDSARASGEPCTAADYATVWKATSKWLDDLKVFGYDVGIFFDGALPGSKRSTRIERLQAYSDRLKISRKAIDPTYCHQITAGLMRYAPPFLVSAIVEALLSHDEYKSVTFIVPGEAEAFCIAAAKSLTIGQGTVSIFSNDSDLLVYRLSEQSLVVPLRDIEVHENSGRRSLSGTSFSSAKLAAQFGPEHDSLVEPAFFIKIDQNRSLTDGFKEAAKLRISKDKELLKQLTSFKQEYDVRNESREWANIQSNPSLCQNLCSADARISELIYQVTHKRYKPSAGLSLDMFFPSLLEDGSRKTAWEAGQDIRVAAYSTLLAFTNRKDENVRLIEHNRSGSPAGIVATEILLHSRSETLNKIGELRDELESRFHCCHQLTISLLNSSSRVNTWHLVILQFLIDDLSAAQKNLPDASDFLAVLAGPETLSIELIPETLSYKQREAHRAQWWKRFHLAAQYQAMYYSFRILQHLLRASLRPVTAAEAAVTLSFSSDFTEQDQQTAERLSSLLETLPNILDFSTSPVNSAESKEIKPTKGKWEKCLNIVITGLQGQQHQPKDFTEHVPRSTSQASKKIVQAENQQGMALPLAVGTNRAGSKRSNCRMSTKTNNTKQITANKNAYDALSKLREEE